MLNPGLGDKKYLGIFLPSSKKSDMSKAENTKAYIVEQTAPIFNKKGYIGTSLTDLTEATGLTKGCVAKIVYSVISQEYNSSHCK